jgi:PTS system nitrogen regulatory IIA component
MLTIPEVVNLLRVPETTIRRWIQQGEFPCTIRNGKPLINQATLISWAEAKHLRLGSSALGKKGNLVSDNLLAALELGGTHYGLKGEDREAVLRHIPGQIRHIPGQMQLNKISPQKLETLLLERENQSSTALGKGVAVPHPRYPLPISKSQSRVDVFFLSSPIEWDAPDGQPVHTLFLLLSAESSHHLKILSQIAGLLRQAGVEDFLQQAPPQDELLDYIQARTSL